jgi:hypothetical protein
MLVTGGEGWAMENLGTIAQGIMRRSLSWASALLQKNLERTVIVALLTLNRSTQVRLPQRK